VALRPNLERLWSPSLNGPQVKSDDIFPSCHGNGSPISSVKDQELVESVVRDLSPGCWRYRA
jgi:hypothetical protein